MEAEHNFAAVLYGRRTQRRGCAIWRQNTTSRLCCMEAEHNVAAVLYGRGTHRITRIFLLLILEEISKERMLALDPDCRRTGFVYVIAAESREFGQLRGAVIVSFH